MPSNRAVSSIKQILSLADDGTVTSTLASVQDLIDSAYVQARVVAGTDSATVIALIDSAYVAARSGGGGGGTDVGDVYTYSLIFGE